MTDSPDDDNILGFYRFDPKKANKRNFANEEMVDIFPFINPVGRGETIAITRADNSSVIALPMSGYGKIDIKDIPMVPRDVSTIITKSDFSELLSMAASGKQIMVLTRHGKPIARLTSEENYMNLLDKEREIDEQATVDFEDLLAIDRWRSERPNNIIPMRAAKRSEREGPA